MKIEIKIGLDTLGDFNTDADNARFAEAVEKAINDEYPNAEIDVELAEHSNDWVSDDPAGHILERVREIQNHVWDQADY
jgi:hypothetical protein